MASVASDDPQRFPGRTAELAYSGAGEDGLTGLPGERFWAIVLEVEAARARRYGRPVTVVLVDVVGLDRVAERDGSGAASGVMQAVARLLRANSRSSDYVARIGSTRFGFLLPETDEIAAINFVERTRARSERELGTGPDAVSLAFGWASPSGGVDLLAAVATAGDRLRREERTPGSPAG